MESSTISLFLTLSLVAATAAGQSSSEEYLDFLEAHNRARAEVGVQPLEWSNIVENFAVTYAQRPDNNCSLVESREAYGENQASRMGQLSAEDAVNIWVSEKPNYDYTSNSCVGGPCQNYTQVVWANSTELGCARQQCTNGLVFAICYYNPPGNFIGERPY
ncbi:basic form of pathogenesis-related protein 1-like [Salvia hispanica]|uniref:basic form of pathogenesis-related protein 1-like n=1 Tax=Salvia hispanica TaxID=49212 RepID=UPI002008F486|nr:basic form of pathogenesis-related protein 1-like [Salvia hispanica]